MSRKQLTHNGTSNQAQSPHTPLSADYLDSIDYYVEGFVLSHRSQQHSPKTIEFYQENLLRFIWFLKDRGFPQELSAITANHIRTFFVYLQETHGYRWGSNAAAANKPLSPSSIHAYARTLRAFWRWAAREGNLQANPMSNISMPKVPTQWKVETYSHDEIVALFAACVGFSTPFLAQRNKTIIAVLLDSGIRASELLGLEVGDIDSQLGAFEVTGKGNKRRPVAIGSFARKELWSYLTHYRLKMNTPDRALFVTDEGDGLSYAGLRGMFHYMAVRSGITRLSVRAHRCRHTFASAAHANGMRGATLQEQLGHADFSTTRKFYLHVSKEDLMQEHEKYGPLDRMSKDIAGLRGKARKTAQASSTPQLDDSGRFAAKLPSAEVLAKEVEQSSYLAVARRYGVSDTAVRKRLKKAGLEVRKNTTI